MRGSDTCLGGPTRSQCSHPTEHPQGCHISTWAQCSQELRQGDSPQTGSGKASRETSTHNQEPTLLLYCVVVLPNSCVYSGITVVGAGAALGSPTDPHLCKLCHPRARPHASKDAASHLATSTDTHTRALHPQQS